MGSAHAQPELRMIENQGTRAQKIVTIYDDIYDLPDCRAYYRAMDHAGFRTAHFAASAFRDALRAVKQERGLETARVVDFASGYGIAAQLMRFDVSLDDVLTRYRDDWFDDASAADVVAADTSWLSQHAKPGTDRYIGIDIAGNALAYGRDVGIFDAAFPENLQDGPPSDALQAELAEVDLIVECGSVAHMLPDALDHLLSACKRKPWVITSPIRGNDTDEALSILAAHGLSVDRQVATVFPHRAFSDPAEQQRAIENAQKRGYDTTGFESEGRFHAQVFLAKPV